ncbi:MAG: PqqD family protein [Promethearchaeota archaeon]
MKEENLEQETQIIIEENTIPVKNSAVTIREEMEEDGKYILFNAENELILVINPTGRFILDNCNGEKTISQIIKDIENCFTVKEDTDLATIVKGFILTLMKARLITIKEEEK